MGAGAVIRPLLIWDFLLLAFGAATVLRVLRKELLQDVRGLRREIRYDEVKGEIEGGSRPVDVPDETTLERM